MSLYLDSLAYLRRFVMGVEALTEQLRLEEKALPSFRGSAFLRELVMENYALWPEALYGPYPLTPSVSEHPQRVSHRRRQGAR